MRGKDFIFDSVQLLYYKCHKINFKRGWIKKATVNPQNESAKSDKCFQYAATVALNHEQIKRDPQRISRIKPFINKYN